MRFVQIFLFTITALVFTGEQAHFASAAVTMTVSNPYCHQSMIEGGACYINIRSITASDSGGGVDHLDISINGKVRTRMQTFFETAAYFSENMLGEGLKVSCGAPNASGDPVFGNHYNVNINAYAGGSSVASDSASVYCPYSIKKTIMFPVKGNKGVGIIMFPVYQ